MGVEENTSEKEPVISIEEGREAFETANKFLEQQEFATGKDVSFETSKSREMINCLSYIPKGDIKEVYCHNIPSGIIIPGINQNYEKEQIENHEA
nr:5743_t:CDS:2 [Entrophospora candida]